MLLEKKPNLKDVPIPYVVKRALLMTAGRWNGVDFPASSIEREAKKLVADKNATVRLFKGATTDHQDSTGTLIGHSEHHEWDGETLWGDCVFIDENAARVAKYQHDTKLKLQGVSPRMTTHPEWKPANGRVEQILEFKSFGIVLDPAQGDQAMLEKDSKGRALLGDGPVVLLEDVTLPFPNEHAARIADPELFARVVQLQELPNGIRVLGGPLKTDPAGSGKTQSYRFPKDKFTVDQARKWLQDHDIKPILFEPASGAEESNLDKNQKKEVIELKRLFCEKCELLFDEGTEKCSQCEGTLKDADEATVTKLEDKAKKEQADKDAKIAVEKKEAADALAKKEADEKAAAEAKAAKEQKIEFPEATHKSKPYFQGPHGYQSPYYGKAEGTFHKEETAVRTHVFVRKPALDQVADLEELTQDFVGLCASVLKAHMEGKLELSEAIVEMGTMLREVPLSAELSKEEVPMDDAFLALVKENEGHKANDLDAELKRIIDDGHKLPPAVRGEVESLLSVRADAVLSDEGKSVDVAGCLRKIVAALPNGATLSMDEKTKRLVGGEARLSKDENKTENEKTEQGRQMARDSGLGATKEN